jgi:hypothetical protein
MIAEHNGVTYAKVPGLGYRELTELTPDEAMLVLVEIERLMMRLQGDADTIRELERRKRAEAGR